MIALAPILPTFPRSATAAEERAKELLEFIQAFAESVNDQPLLDATTAGDEQAMWRVLKLYREDEGLYSWRFLGTVRFLYVDGFLAKAEYDEWMKRFRTLQVVNSIFDENERIGARLRRDR